ncbi:MAG: H-NS histone family protein [Thiohalocapsa sp.]
MEFQDLSLEELQEQLSNIEQNKINLEKALYQRWHDAKAELAQEIRGMIEGRGYEVDDILAMVGPRRRRSAGAPKKSNRSYTRYVDPEDSNNIYVRGVLPRWMKEKMAAQGYDPSAKEDREAFKANYLQPLQD